MIFKYHSAPDSLLRLPDDVDPAAADWIDLYRPEPAEVAALTALGITVPPLDAMEEIEISSRLYRDGDTDVMTVVLPGLAPNQTRIAAPVTFIVTPDRLVTVRHHTPRPFATYPSRAQQSPIGCATHLEVFLGLVDEIVARLADLLESTGRSLDTTAAQVFAPDATRNSATLSEALRTIGQEGESLAQIRLALLSVERMLSSFQLLVGTRHDADRVKAMIKALMRDIKSLAVHADFLGNRISLTNDTTLGMINLAQNATVRILSVVAALFLPPTLIASIYGMNFRVMPELALAYGYPLALGMMAVASLGTFLFFKWRGWL